MQQRPSESTPWQRLLKDTKQLILDLPKREDVGTDGRQICLESKGHGFSKIKKIAASSLHAIFGAKIILKACFRFVRKVVFP